MVAIGAAEKARGPGRGLKAACGEAPARIAPAAAPQSAIAPRSTAVSLLTGELRNQIDRILDAFWSGGIANPLEVVAQPVDCRGRDGAQLPGGDRQLLAAAPLWSAQEERGGLLELFHLHGGACE